MIQIVDKIKCCGCTACYNACPKKAINMQSDMEGFLYPEINDVLCVDCGICNRVCPVENPPMASDDKRLSFAIRAKDHGILKESTSGGFITPLIAWVWNKQGIVCAATYNNKFQVVHKSMRDNDSISSSRIRGSKYVQSDLGRCFSEIKDYLKRGKVVCFIGTTCQVNGLKTFLGKDYAHLILVDLVCHGTPSPKLWNKYLEYQKNKYQSEITEIFFRNKTYGYHSGTMKIQFANGKIYYGSARVDYMLKSFFKEISSRPICYHCPFKTLKRCSDFTIYDCWHAEELVSGLKDDDKGFTNVIVQSEKGMRIFEQIRDKYEVYPVDTVKAVKLDGIMVLNSAKAHPQRDKYYIDMDNDTLPQHIQKFIPITKKDYVIEKMKLIVYRLGILRILKRVKK